MDGVIVNRRDVTVQANPQVGLAFFANRGRDEDAIPPDDGARMTEAGNGGLPLDVGPSEDVPLGGGGKPFRDAASLGSPERRPLDVLPLRAGDATEHNKKAGQFEGILDHDDPPLPHITSPLGFSQTDGYNDGMKWFDRKFPFQTPAELYPQFMIRLRGTAARLEELTRHLSQPVLTAKPDDKWSIQENVGHLVDLEELWDARLGDFLEGKDTLTPADLENRKTHEARHNNTPPGMLLKGFRQAREHLLERLDRLPPEDFAKTSRHPRLVDMLEFIAEHDDHHLARIWELLRASHAG
jgi:hypothetical protein